MLVARSVLTVSESIVTPRQSEQSDFKRIGKHAVTNTPLRPRTSEIHHGSAGGSSAGEVPRCTETVLQQYHTKTEILRRRTTTNPLVRAYIYNLEDPRERTRRKSKVLYGRKRGRTNPRASRHGSTGGSGGDPRKDGGTSGRIIGRPSGGTPRVPGGSRRAPRKPRGSPEEARGGT